MVNTFGSAEAAESKLKEFTIYWQCRDDAKALKTDWEWQLACQRWCKQEVEHEAKWQRISSMNARQPSSSQPIIDMLDRIFEESERRPRDRRTNVIDLHANREPVERKPPLVQLPPKRETDEDIARRKELATKIKRELGTGTR